MSMKIEHQSNIHDLVQGGNNSSHDLNEYRLLKLNAYQGQNSWDFCGRDGAHGPYAFPFHGLKNLLRKN